MSKLKKTEVKADAAKPAAAGKKFVVGVIGAGRIGKIHAFNLSRIADVKLKIIVDANINDEMKAWAAGWGFNLQSDPSLIFNDPEINIVAICSSTDTHREYARKAAEAKKQIFCEKPIDTDATEAKKTLEIVKNAGVKMQLGFNRRFDHNFKRVHDAGKQIGDPMIIKVTSRDPGAPPLSYVKVSGGLFKDMTIHDWDMLRFQANSEVDEVYATGGALVPKADPKESIKGIDIDTAVAIVKFKNGAIGVVDNCRQAVYGYDQRVEVFATKGAAMADNDTQNNTKVYLADHSEVDRIPDFFLQRYMESFEIEMKAFMDAIRANKEPSPNGDDGLNDLLVAIAAGKSLAENRPVKISEIKY